MALFIHDFSVAASPATALTPDLYAAINGRTPQQGNGYVNDEAATGASNPPELVFDKDTVTGGSLPFASLFTGAMRVQRTQHTDFHYRLWLIPRVLSLVNPELDADVPFRLWNTFTDSETLASVVVSGSSVLTFDVGPGTVIRDGEYRLVNLRIAAGEPTVDALVVFTSESGQGQLRVLADVSDVFTIAPDVPVVETWEYLTEVLTSYDGREQRVCHRVTPRVRMSLNVRALDMADRVRQYELFVKNLRVQSVLPLFQYGADVQAITAPGGSRLYFDPVVTNIQVGQPLVAIRESTGQKLVGTVTIVHADGATIGSSATTTVDGSWTVYPGLYCIIADKSGLTFDSVAGSMKVSVSSYSEPDVRRVGAPSQVQFLDGLPILDRAPLAGDNDEGFQFRREVLDFETGARDINSADTMVRVTGTRNFRVDRVLSATDMDYWREFLDLTKGAWKPFLLSTNLPDMTLVVPLVQNGSSMQIAQGYAPSQLHSSRAYEHIEFEFNGGLISRHTILSSTRQSDGSAIVTFTPALPDSPLYVTPSRVSYLLKVRGSDTVSFSHSHIRSTVTLEVITTDEG